MSLESHLLFYEFMSVIHLVKMKEIKQEMVIIILEHKIFKHQ